MTTDIFLYPSLDCNRTVLGNLDKNEPARLPLSGLVVLPKPRDTRGASRNSTHPPDSLSGPAGVTKWYKLP